MVIEPPEGLSSERYYGAWIGSAEYDVVLENPDDLTLGTNDTHEMAEPVGSGFPAGDQVVFIVEGELTEGDVDWWYVPPGTGGDIEGACKSLTYGSGVLALTVDAYPDSAPDGPSSLGVTESITAEAAWGAGTRAPALPGQGGYFIRLSSSSFDAEVTGRRYRCQFAR